MWQKIKNWLNSNNKHLSMLADNSSCPVYLNDPSSPNLIAQEDEPAETVLSMRAIGEGNNHQLGSIQQQALSVKLAVNDALKYMSKMSPVPIRNWAATQSLLLVPRAGADVNAYYDRGALRFFYFGDPVAKKNIFACDSRPVVAHEFGHAFLDILRPDLWDVQASEIWAFHEAFGDITALLSALQYDELIADALKETEGNLLKSNILTRMAAQMGVGLYHLTGGKDGELPNCLRDISQVFYYSSPERLPAQGRDDVIVNEPHSFSRIFSGVFYEILVKVANRKMQEGVSPAEAVKQSRDIMADCFLKAVVSAPATVKMFDAVAQQMLHVDHASGGHFQDIMEESFQGRKIIENRIMMLEELDLETVTGGLVDSHEVQVHGNKKIVRTLAPRTMRLSDRMQGLGALEDNPLLSLEITVPNQTCYYFENDKLVDVVSPNETTIVNAAAECLFILNSKKLVGVHGKAIFVEIEGKLVRSQIACTCNRPNYCDPNAPEYGKPWKPANNSGCVACGTGTCLPRACNCEQPEAPAAPKLGCYVTAVAGGTGSYRVGSAVSRKVC